jgi:hypothetical protein
MEGAGRKAGPLFCIYSSVQMRVLVGLSCLALAVTAGAQATLPRGTLTGVVKRGPITPVCAVEQPCDEPARNVTLLFSRNGAVVASVVTDGQGRYRRRLPAGTYGVRRPAATTVDRKLEPNRVRVYAGRVRNVDFSIDTGIR